jgi:hypothetical protein
MYAACTFHAHPKHVCCMQATHTLEARSQHAIYDGRTHTTSTMNPRVHAPKHRGCEHACMHVHVCSMHACSVRHACLYGVQATSIYSCWERKGIVQVPYLLQNCPTI